MLGGNTRRGRPLLMLVALLAPAAALAGCAEDAPATAPAATRDDANAPTTPDAGADAADATDEASGAAPAPLAPATTRTLYLDAGGVLADTLPSAGSEPMAGSYVACFVTRPCAFHAYESPAIPTSILVMPGEITFDLWYEATAPVAPSGAFDNGVWFGSTQGTYANTVDNGNQPYLPGEPIHVQVTLDTSGLAPIVVPAGDAIRVLALSGRVHEGAGILRILYGGETASSVTFTARDLPADALVKPALNETKLQGMLEEPAFIVGDVTGGGEGKTFVTHRIAVPADATWLELELQATGGPIQKPDVDLDIAVGGQQLAHAGTPTDHERLLFAGPALDGIRGKDVDVIVRSFFAAQTPYDLTVRIG